MDVYINGFHSGDWEHDKEVQEAAAPPLLVRGPGDPELIEPSPAKHTVEKLRAAASMAIEASTTEG